MRFSAKNLFTGELHYFILHVDSDNKRIVEYTLDEKVKREMSATFFNDNYGKIFAEVGIINELLQTINEMLEAEKEEEIKTEVLASFSFDTCTVGLIKKGDTFYVNNTEQTGTPHEVLISTSMKDGTKAAYLFFELVRMICDEQMTD